MTKLFRVLGVVIKTYAFDVEAETENEALDKIGRSCGGTTGDITRCPEYDSEVSCEYQCIGSE